MQHLSQRFLAQKIFTHPWKWWWTKKRARMKLGPEMETYKSSSITSSIVIIPMISSSFASFGSGLSTIWRISLDGVRDHPLEFTDPLSSSYVWQAGKLFHFWNSLLFGKGFVLGARWTKFTKKLNKSALQILAVAVSTPWPFYKSTKDGVVAIAMVWRGYSDISRGFFENA